MDSIKTKIVEFERENRLVPKAIGACTALSMGVITAFAEGEGSSGIDTVTSAMTTELSGMVTKVATVCAGLVGAALTIFGIKWAIKTVKSFFSRIAG